MEFSHQTLIWVNRHSIINFCLIFRNDILTDLAIVHLLFFYTSIFLDTFLAQKIVETYQYLWIDRDKIFFGVEKLFETLSSYSLQIILNANLPVFFYLKFSFQEVSRSIYVKLFERLIKAKVNISLIDRVTL